MGEAIAIVGNSSLNIGAFMAGDQALAGDDVRFLLWPDQSEVYETVRAAGGVTILPPVAETKSGKTGLGIPRLVTQNVEEAISGASLVVMDVDPSEIEERFVRLLPHLSSGQVVHINTHGYWPALRLAYLLKQSGKTGVTLTEGIAPTIAGGREQARITPHVIRKNLLVSVFPSAREAVGLRQLERICHSIEPAQNVIHSNLTSMNFLVHPGFVLGNIGYFNRAAERGEKVSVYGVGSTESSEALIDALDRERPDVCKALKVPYRSTTEQMARIYTMMKLGPLREMVINTPFNQLLPANIWRTWMGFDIPFAHVPFVRLAESLGISVPLHRGFVDVIDALTDKDSWENGLTLCQLGLDGMDAKEITRFVTEGHSE